MNVRYGLAGATRARRASSDPRQESYRSLKGDQGEIPYLMVFSSSNAYQ